MIDGARVEVAPYKRDPADFVLWKPSTPEQPGWDSPYGRGRPGWHLECSAMVEAHLGVTVDIHGGGQDLKFPHHENELAQSACAHGGAPLARFWLHNGFLDVEQEKMSKSLGNVLLVRDLLKESAGRGDPLRPARPRTIASRWLVERGRPRAGQARARPALSDAERPARTRRARGAVRRTRGRARGARGRPQHAQGLRRSCSRSPARPTPADDRERAARAQGRASWPAGACSASSTRTRRPASGGCGVDAPRSRGDSRGAHGLADVDRRARDRALVELPAARRATKNFTEADRIRDELAAAGVTLEDGPEGTRWRRAG